MFKKLWKWIKKAAPLVFSILGKKGSDDDPGPPTSFSGTGGIGTRPRPPFKR